MVYWTMADWELFGWIALVMGVVLLIVGIKMWRDEDNLLFILMGLLFITPGFTSLLMIHYEKENGIMETVMESPEEYSFYLDGEDVDYDKIDLDQYKITYDLENKKVFLSRK